MPQCLLRQTSLPLDVVEKVLTSPFKGKHSHPYICKLWIYGGIYYFKSRLKSGDIFSCIFDNSSKNARPIEKLLQILFGLVLPEHTGLGRSFRQDIYIELTRN